MPHHKSAMKRVLTNEIARVSNRQYKRRLHNSIRKLHEASNSEEANTRLRATISLLDRLAGKNIIHKNSASKRKAKLSRFVAKMNF